MITELKKVLKLFSYCFQWKRNCVGILLISSLGGLIILCSSFNLSLFFVGCVYFILGPFNCTQLFTHTLFANIVKASPKHKTLELLLPNILTAIIEIVGYTVIITYCIITNSIAGPTYSSIHFLLSSLLLSIISLYMCVAYKHFVISTCFMCVFMLPIQFFYAFLLTGLPTSDLQLSIPASCIIGYLIQLFTILLTMLLRKIIYRHPFSKLAISPSLRKQL